LLGAFITTTQQSADRLPFALEIHAISGPDVNSQFHNSRANRSGITKMAPFERTNAVNDPGLAARILEPFEPGLENLGPKNWDHDNFVPMWIQSHDAIQRAMGNNRKVLSVILYATRFS